MSYARFAAMRVVKSIPVLFGVTLLVFWMIHLVPGDPAASALGTRATPEGIARLHQQWGLDQSLPSQYLLFLQRLVTGDLGTSLQYEQSAGALIIERLPVTLWLIVYATVLCCLIAMPLAMVAASRRGAMADRLIRVLSVAGLGIPAFWLGLILVQVVAIEAQLLPAAGFGEGFAGHLESMFLPSLTVAIGITPLALRSLRAELLRVGEADFVMTARAKGLSERRIRYRHVLRNALAPSVTVLTLNLSFLVGGSMVVERVFGLGGVGDLMLSAIGGRDFPLVQAITFVFALMVIVLNILGDLVQAMLDPRVEAR